MRITASVKEIRVSPRKVRLIADSIRSLSLSEAQDALSVIDKRGGYAMEKVLKSAIANAVNNKNLDRSNLYIADVNISEGQSLKRYRPSTRGRIHRYKKRSSSVRIVLEERVVAPAIAAPKAEPKVEEPKAKVSKVENKEETK